MLSAEMLVPTGRGLCCSELGELLSTEGRCWYPGTEFPANDAAGVTLGVTGATAAAAAAAPYMAAAL